MLDVNIIEGYSWGLMLSVKLGIKNIAVFGGNLGPVSFDFYYQEVKLANTTIDNWELKIGYNEFNIDALFTTPQNEGIGIDFISNFINGMNDFNELILF